MWAAMHPEESVAEASTSGLVFGELAVPLAGEGAPLVAEFAPMEFGAALGMSTDAARTLVGDALELAHRLKRTWKLVRAGKVPLWKARRLAQLTTDAAARPARTSWTASSPDSSARSAGPGSSASSTRPASPSTPKAPRRTAARPPTGAASTSTPAQATHDGIAHVEGVLDLADAIDLDTAIRHGAEELAALGSTESLDVRRSMAAGELARRQLAFDLRTEADGAVAGAASVVKPRQVVIHVHLADAAISRDEAGIAHVEETRSIVSTEQVRDWCSGDAQVVVKPVIDLEAHHHSDAYAIPDRLADQTRLVQSVCAFPWCERPARRCDTDHVTAHGDSPSAVRRAAAISPRSAGDITGPRPTPRGPTTRPTRRRTSGDRRTDST